MTLHPTTFMMTPMENHQSHGKNAKTQSSAKNMAGRKLQWSEVPPEIQQAIQYLEYRKLRHKHPHV